MSTHPSLSKSRKAQPAPVVSGRYFSGDFPAVWRHVIPLIEDGTSSKGYETSGRANPYRPKAWKRMEPAILRRNRRRDGCQSEEGPEYAVFKVMNSLSGH